MTQMPETIYLTDFGYECDCCRQQIGVADTTDPEHSPYTPYHRHDKYEALLQSHDRLVCGIRRSIQLLSNRGYQKEASELLDILPDEPEAEKVSGK